MIEQLRLLIELQQFDAQIQELQQSMQALPEKLAPAKQDLAKLEALLQGEKDQLEATQEWRREQESILEQEQDAIKKAKARQQASSNTREFAAANRELENKRKSMSEREEEVLKVIDAIEASGKSIAEHDTDVQKLRDHVAADEKETNQKVAELRAKIDASMGNRGSIAEKVEEDLLKKYEHVRRSRGIAIVEVVKGGCAGCHMQLPPQLVNILARGDSLENCPQCRRLLYREAMLDDVQPDR